MRKIPVIFLTVGLLGGGTAVAVRAARSPHPDSKTESIADGCNRTQLGLLGEAAATLLVGPHPTAFASWVYVNGDRTPKTLDGKVLGTHTAGSDLFGVHDTYDVNFDVQPDAASDRLLSTMNASEKPAQIHTEWESGLAPLFAWPSSGDRVRETGSEVWDCGHWQSGNRALPNSDLVPGDPLATAGVEPVGGEEIEIHPISELATWRTHGDFVPVGSTRPVHASALDVAISNQGGKAKGVEECALLSPREPGAPAGRLVNGVDCSQLQDVTGHDYTYDLTPPGPKPTKGSKLVVQQDIHYTHNGPAPRAKIVGGHVRITIPFGRIKRGTALQDLGASWHAWWTDDTTPVHRFNVSVQSVTIRNNLDGDNPANATNPGTKATAAWNMYLDVAGQWINLHDPRAGHVDYLPHLGAVPSAKTTPVVLSARAVPTTDVVVPDGAAVHVFTDARQCQQPGFIDCPTTELGTNGRSAGRADMSLPVSQLIGRSTLVTIHPPVCPPGADCPEDKNPQSLCPAGCYDVTYRIDDAGVTAPAIGAVVRGDGTAAASTVGAESASIVPWWIAPITQYGPSQGEENITVARVLADLQAALRR